jgi:hypothetical protein
MGLGGDVGMLNQWGGNFLCIKGHHLPPCFNFTAVFLASRRPPLSLLPYLSPI